MTGDVMKKTMTQMRAARLMLTGVLVAALVACGGGGGSSGTSKYAGDTAAPVAPVVAATVTSLDLVAESLQLNTGATDAVKISATVKTTGNLVLSGANVTFTSSAGNLTVISGTSNASGVTTATLSLGTAIADKANKAITVTATSGGQSQTLTFQVVGTSISYSGPTSLTASATPVTLTVFAKDSKGQPISGAQIAVGGSLISNTLSTSLVTTDSSGSATVRYTPINSGVDAVTFTGLGATPVTAAIAVSGEDFTYTTPSADASINVGASQSVSVQYKQNGLPVSGRTVMFAATAGTLSLSSATTNASGVATTFISSTFAGKATLSAAIVGVTTITLPVEFVAVTPSKLVLQATPTALGPNATGSTTQQASLVARVTDSGGNPVKNVTVNFSRSADPSGGTLSQPSAQTDSNGNATVKYISGPNSTASGGVVVVATVLGTAVTDSKTLTVNQSPLFIALGTGNVIGNVDEQTYKKDWTVYVTDANGVAVPNITLTLRVLPVQYIKGELAYFSTSSVWGLNTAPYSGAQSASVDLARGEWLACDSEDQNSNGVLDVGEDFNSSGALEPGNVISVTPSNITTDSSGRATLSLQYAESYVPWVKVTLRATASVSGTESYRDATFVVTGLATDFNKQDTPPAGVVSPFGIKASCSSKD
jgi:protocatechuate 3,4-dioxygenase beta subunit